MIQETSVLPVYLIHWNAPEWISSSVRSVLHSRGVSVRLIIVDNGQEQDSNLQDLFPSDVEIVPAGRNLGFAGGSNLALAHWAGRFPECPFAVIGSHDLHVHSDTFCKLLETMRTHANYGIIGPTLKSPFESTGGLWGKTGAYQVPLMSGEGLIERDWISGTFMLLRRECMDELGRFDERFESYCEDVDLGLRACALGWKVGVLLEAQAWSLGSRSPAAWTLIEANGVLLAAKHLGPRGAIASLWRLCVWAGRALGGSLAPWRSEARRKMSAEFLNRHLRALGYLAHRWRVVTALLVDGRVEGRSNVVTLEHGAPRSQRLPKRTSCFPEASLVSVVTPTRNRLAFLQEAVESVRHQTYEAWELIVVDDASEDGTWAWLSSLADPRIRALRLERHSERSAARNRGLAQAQGEFVLFLDDDDRLCAHAIECLVGALANHPDAVASVGARCYTTASGRCRRVWHPPVTVKRVVWMDVLFAAWSVAQGQALFRKQAVSDVGGWDERVPFGEDHELWLRVSELGPAVCTPSLVLQYRVHPQDFSTGLREPFERARANYLTTFGESQRHTALRILEAHEAWRRGMSALGSDSYGSALREFVLSAWNAPFLLRSPLSGPVIVGAIARTALYRCLGQGGTSFLRRLTRGRNVVGGMAIMRADRGRDGGSRR